MSSDTLAYELSKLEARSSSSTTVLANNLAENSVL